MNRLLFDVPPEADEVLPALTGSAAQIAWAEKVRAGKLAGVRSAIREMQELIARYQAMGHADAAETHRERLLLWMDREEPLAAQQMAGWWIDHRENSPIELLNGTAAKPGSEGYYRPENAEAWTP